MTDVVLFHHANGLTPGVQAFAYQLAAAGNNVTVPDLYDGKTFAGRDEGMAHAGEVGVEGLVELGSSLVDELPGAVVYAGFSLGGLVAHKLAQTREGAVGAVLYHYGDVPIEMFGDSWPAGVDLQIHINEDDELYEPKTVTEFIERAGDRANAELFTYPGSGHLFTDYTTDDYNAASTDLVIQRTLDFLDNH